MEAVFWAFTMEDFLSGWDTCFLGCIATLAKSVCHGFQGHWAGPSNGIGRSELHHT